MVGVSVNIKYSYHVINVKQYLRTPVQRAIRTGGRGALPPPSFGENQLSLFQPGDTAQTYHNPITAMGFSAMFTFQLDNTKR